MKKVKLLQYSVPGASGVMQREYAKDHQRKLINRNSHKYDYFASASVHDGILMVRCHTRTALGYGIKEPRHLVFIDKKNNEYCTYDRVDKKWRTAKINMLEGLHSGWRLWSTWSTKADRQLVNDYFETGKYLDIEAAVLEFQAGIKREALAKAHRKETDQIDSVMNEVPDMPKGFEKWVIKNCFEEVCFYKPEKYKWPKMYCTHCGKWSDAPGKPEHNEAVICPKCRTKAVYKSWNKQKYADQRTDVAVLQRLKDDSGWILRRFNCKLLRHHVDGWNNQKLRVIEDVRARLDDSFNEMEFFEWGEYKYTGVFRWCHTARNTIWGYYSPREFGRTLMYTPNLKKVLKGTGIENMDFKKLFVVEEKKRIGVVRILRLTKRYPFIEYMQKIGLNTLVRDCVQYINYRLDIAELINPEGKSLTEIFMIDKQRMNRLVKLDGDRHILSALQYEASTGSRISDKNLEYCRQNEIFIKDLPLEATGMNAERTINYLSKQAEKNGMTFGQLLRMYEDYLDMAETFGADLKDEIICHTSDLIGWHDKYVEKKNKRKARYRDTEVNKKYGQIKEDYIKNHEHFAWENDELVMLIPKKASDITKEGRVQHHCVGASDMYISRMNERQNFILFLRHKDRPKEAYYTIECKWDGQVLQWYGAYDRKPDEDKIDEVLKEWSEEIGKRTKELIDKQVKAIEADGLKAIIKYEGAEVYAE